MEPTQDLPISDAEPRETCTNCGKKMAKKGKFCPHCGQKRFATKVALKVVFKQFFYKLTNLDSKILRMMWRLLIPGQVTLDYFSGKVKQYPHPFQFFFVVMFFFLLAFNKVTDSGTKGVHFNITGQPNGDVGLVSDDSIKNQLSQTKQNDPYFLLERYVFSRQVKRAFDSLPPHLHTPTVRAALDTVLNKTNGAWTKSIDALVSQGNSKDSLNLNFGPRIIKVAYEDVVEYSPDEIIERYQVKDWFGRILLKQGIRSIQSPQNLIAAYIGSFSWTILALIMVMAGCLYLFYWRRKRYYVEHLVLLLHWHSGVFLVLTIFLGINEIWELGENWLYVMLAVFGFLWATMYRYYQQNLIWTSFKWFGFLLVYCLGFAVFFVLGLLVVFALF